METKLSRARAKKSISAKIKKTGRGRKIVVFRSNRYISAQIIDIVAGKTLVSVFGKKLIGDKKMTKKEAGFAVGEDLAKRAIKAGIKNVVFDRRGYAYHGRVAAVAEGARKGGLKF